MLSDFKLSHYRISRMRPLETRYTAWVYRVKAIILKPRPFGCAAPEFLCGLANILTVKFL
jgi:hypothetical protein